MDSINIDKIKIEKAKAIHKHRQLRNISNFVRFVEVCVFLVLISRFSGQLPVAVKNSGGYFRELSGIMVSPRFVFIVGNVIIITLFAKSGQFSSQDSGAKNSGTDFYDEYLKKSEKTQIVRCCEIEHQEKKIIHEDIAVSVNSHTSVQIKNFGRIQSANLVRKCEKSCRDLRRSETEKCRKSCYAEDEMSNEEFRRTIEAFIARQQRLRREEAEYTL